MIENEEDPISNENVDDLHECEDCGEVYHTKESDDHIHALYYNNTMSEKKRTAVMWLIEKMPRSARRYYSKEIQQALQMERDQREDTSINFLRWYCENMNDESVRGRLESLSINEAFNQYYTDTYGE